MKARLTYESDSQGDPVGEDSEGDMTRFEQEPDEEVD